MPLLVFLEGRLRLVYMYICRTKGVITPNPKANQFENLEVVL